VPDDASSRKIRPKHAPQISRLTNPDGAALNSRFSGFGPTSIAFLKQLAAHNKRDWFQANKARYESDVLQPALDFITDMAPRIARISSHFDAIAKRQGGSLMRVYRDTRFGGDKSPYKTNVGIQFRHQAGNDVHAPGFYVHIEPGACFLGAGIWRPDTEPLRRIRQRIAAEPRAWRKVIGNAGFGRHWRLGGDALQRPPKGFAADHEFVEDLKRKDFIADSDLADRNVAGADLLRLATDRFKAATPLMQFLCDALELPF
jgi:uncharacterized protein (TIGR02453 family)